MKRIVRLFILSLSVIFFFSCELLNQIQLFPQEITIMEESLDLSGELGVYEVWGNDRPFEMLYLETLGRKLILINSRHSSEGYPNALIIDAESLKILKDYNNGLSLYNIQPSLVNPNIGVENEFIGQTSLNQNLESVWVNQTFSTSTDLHWDTLLFVLDATVDSENSYAFEIINQENIDGTTEFPSAISLILKGEIKHVEVTNSTSTWIERQLSDSTASLSLSFSGTFHPAGSVNDIQEGKSFFYGFSPVDIYSYKYGMDNLVQVNSTFTVYEIDPAGPSLSRTIRLEGTSDYSWFNMDNLQSIHKADLHYTRKGWVLKKEGSNGFPHYFIHDPATGNELNQDSISAANALAACFDFNGEHYYYIDQRSLKLIKAVTPW